MSNRYAVTLRLVVAGADRAAHFERVVDEYAALERRDERLLDCAWSFGDGRQHAEVEVEVTAEAGDEAAAYGLASSSVRAAIHAAGGFTPGWDEPAPELDGVVYRLTHEAVTPVG